MQWLKLTGIELANSLSLQFGHKILNLMPTNLYGPNDNFSEMDSHVIPGLIFRMHNAKINGDKEFKIWGTGKPLREFMYVDDLAKAILFLINNVPKDSLINVGSGEEISIENLSILIKEIVGYKGILNFDSKMPDGNPRKLLDSTLINELGWTPEIDLNSGIKKTYKWFLENYN